MQRVIAIIATLYTSEAFQLPIIPTQRQVVTRKRTDSFSYQTFELCGRFVDDESVTEQFVEEVLGGWKYEMVELPNSLLDTTIFVGNLCEFVTDDMLSNLFQEVSFLQQVPACVLRKPNYSSKKYGFVTFPNVDEKEDAIVRFNGYKLNNRNLKVEDICDFASKRVQVPEEFVTYSLGSKKKSDGSFNNLWNAVTEDNKVGHGNRNKKSRRKVKSASVKSDDYKQRDIVRKKSRMKVIRRVNDSSSPVRNSLEHAATKGYVTLEGTGFRRGRKSSTLAIIHRELCDLRNKPQVIHCKASSGRILDNVIIDLSPLRIGGLSNATEQNNIWRELRTTIVNSAEDSGMILNPSYEEDNTENIILVDQEKENLTNDQYNKAKNIRRWNNGQIKDLPSVSIGVFEGERVSAKAMIKELAQVWGLEDSIITKEDLSSKVSIRRKDFGKDGHRKQKTKSKKIKSKTLSQHRKENTEEMMYF